MTERKKFLKDNFTDLSLSERFFRIREISSDNSIDFNKLLPEKVSFDLESEEEITSRFLIAGGLWKDIYERCNFKETLVKISEKTLDYTQEIYDNVKNVRICGGIFRDANRLFSEEHFVPESFYNSIKLLGYFKDNYLTQVKDISIIDVIDVFDKCDFDTMLKKYNPCSTESLKKYLIYEKDLIVSYLKEEKISVENLHDLRRTNRRFVNFFLLDTLGKVNDNSIDIYIYLKRINTCLGEFLDNNNVLEQPLPKEQLVEIPNEAKNLLSSFFDKAIL